MTVDPKVHRLSPVPPIDWGDAAAAERADSRPPMEVTQWTADRFRGEPPALRYLVSGSVPLGVPGLVGAQGDTGKSMLLLELARRVAFGSSPLDPPIFGGDVEREGVAVMLTAEDDEGTVHRRLAALDRAGQRHTSRAERLMIVPLPSAGGSYPLFDGSKDGMHVTDNFKRLQDQLAAIKELALVVFDPMQAFVLAPINEDPAAGQFACTETGALAAETGATILYAHHMKKTLIRNLESAREAIRGTSAIVDGVRFAYALWPAEEGDAKAVCRELRRPYQHNAVVFGGVIKANGPARRVVRTYVRNDVGLLVDESSRLVHSAVDQLDILDSLVQAIAAAAERGQPLTKSGINGLWEQRSRLPEHLRETARNRFIKLADDALIRGLLVQASAKGSTSTKWLDVPTGPFATGYGVFVVGGKARETIVGEDA